MKRIGSIAAGFLLGLALAACQPATHEKRTVSLIHYFTGSLSSGVAEMASAFNKEGSGIELVPTPLEHETFKTAIRVQLEGPNPPDLFSYWAGDKTSSLVAAGLVSPMDKVFAAEGLKDLFPTSVMTSLSYGGKPYMLPLTRHYVGFFYSQKLFAQYGLKPPGTWRELEKIATTLAGHKITPFAVGGKSRWPVQFWFDYLLLRGAGYQYREKLMAGAATWKDPEVATTFQTWRSMLERRWFNLDWADIEWDQAARRVIDDRAGMTLMGTWTIALFTDSKADYPKDYGFFTFPVLDPHIEDAALGPIDGIMMSAKPRSADDSRDILVRLGEAKIQAAFNVAAGAIAPNRLVPDDAYPPLQRQIKKLIEAAPHWAFNFDLASPAEVSEAGLNGFVAFMKTPSGLPAVLDSLEQARIATKKP